MKLTFNITYLTLAGKTQVDTVEISLADFAAWERRSRKRVQDLATGMGIDDMSYLCWHRLHVEKRDSRDYETWLESVQLIESEQVEPANPTEPAQSDGN